MIPTSIPTQNTYRLVHVLPEPTREVARIEDMAADALGLARDALAAIHDAVPQATARAAERGIDRLAAEVEARRALSEAFRLGCLDVLRALARWDPDDAEAGRADRLQRQLREALNLSHRVADRLAAEEDVRRHRGTGL